MTLIKNPKELKEIALFADLPDDRIRKYARFTEELEFGKGERLFSEGDPPAHLWMIFEGEVKVFKEYPSGKSAVIGLFDKGAVVAEVAIIDGDPYPASCQAVTPGRAGMIKREDALRIITTDPIVARKAMMNISRKLRDITDTLGSMSVQSVIRRLSRFLVRMAENMGTQEPGGVQVKLFLTRQDLAECIGTSFEVAVRGLGRLQNEGVIEVDRKNILITDMKRLAKIASE